MAKRRSILIIVLALVMIVSLASCGSTDIKKQSAYDLIKNAVEKTSKLDSYEVDMTVKTTIDAYGSRMETPVTFNMKVANATGKDMEAAGKMSMSVFEQNIDVDMYYGNETIYMDILGTKLKIAASDEEAATYNFENTQKNLLKELPEDILKEVTNINHDDGSRTVSVMIDGPRFNEIFRDMIESSFNGDAYAEMYSDLKTDISIKDANVSVTVLPSGYISEYKMQFSMDVTLKSASENLDYSFACDVDASIKFVSPGTKVTVTAPSDLDKYIDYKAVSDD